MSPPPFAFLPIVLLVLSSGAAVPLGYVPHPGDKFVYAETIQISNGTGNYTGYTEVDHYTGNIAVTAVAANLTVSASYAASGNWSNNQGQSGPWAEKGTFSFSASTYHYVQGSDNQTGYVDPYTWFFMDNTLASGQSFYSLNTHMSVVSTNYSFPMASSSTGYVKTIFAEGNGSYQRNDSYGVFDASYNWKEYYDPGTGFIVGYRYTETDRDAGGNGFTYTDDLTDTSTTFSLTPAAAPTSPSSPSQGGGFAGNELVFAVVLLVVAVVVIVIVAVLLKRRSQGQPKMDRNIPRHAHAEVPAQAPTYGPPAPVRLTPADQPAVQQIVIRETVKVPCRFCGTLIDSTDTSCPKCGAPRT